MKERACSCVMCGVPFFTTRVGRQVCSTFCGREHRLAYAREYGRQYRDAHQGDGAHRLRRLAAMQRWMDKPGNRERIRAKQRERRRLEADAINERARKRYKDNPEVQERERARRRSATIARRVLRDELGIDV